MTETLLHGTNLQRACLQNNEMHNLAAEGLSLQGADLRGSIFNNLDPRLIDLSDVIMTPEQMVYLAHCLDIQLADLD